MGSRRSAFVASGITLTILAAIIVTCWLRYRPRAPIVAIIPETTAQELWESEHAGVAATITGTPWGTYWNAAGLILAPPLELFECGRESGAVHAEGEMRRMPSPAARDD